MSQESVEAGEEQPRAQEALAALLCWMDSCADVPLGGRELDRLDALLKAAAEAAPEVPSEHRGVLRYFFGAQRGSPIARWLASEPRVWEVARFLRACHDKGVPLGTAARVLRMGLAWFCWDSRCRALYGSRGGEPVGLSEAMSRPGFGPDFLRLFGPKALSLFPEGQKWLRAVLRGELALPRPGHRLHLAATLVALAAAGFQPGHAELRRMVDTLFPQYDGGPDALRQMWSRVTRRASPGDADVTRAGPRVLEEDFDWGELGAGSVIGDHRPTGITEVGPSRAAVVAAVAARLSQIQRPADWEATAIRTATHHPTRRRRTRLTSRK